jgi:hypothetical protein
MKRSLYFAWFVVKPSLVWGIRAVFWAVTAPVGLLLVVPRALPSPEMRPIWLPILMMGKIENGAVQSRLAAARKSADEAVAAIPITERETLLRAAGSEE